MDVLLRLKQQLRRKWIRLLAAVVLVLIVAVFVVLEALRLISVQRGVESVSLPAGSEVEARANGADYVDAYRANIPDPLSLDQIERFAFQRGTMVISTLNEIVYESGAPGLRFLVSYYLTDPGPEQSVTVSTVVFYESVLGAIYFSPVKQIHRRCVPFIVSRLVDEER